MSGTVSKETFLPKQPEATTFLMLEHPFAGGNLTAPLTDTSGRRLFVPSVF